jgi:hypothetical protein
MSEVLEAVFWSTLAIGMCGLISAAVFGVLALPSFVLETWPVAFIAIVMIAAIVSWS